MSAPWCPGVKSWAGTLDGDRTDPSPQTWQVRSVSNKISTYSVSETDCALPTKLSRTYLISFSSSVTQSMGLPFARQNVFVPFHILTRHTGTNSSVDL